MSRHFPSYRAKWLLYAREKPFGNPFIGFGTGALAHVEIMKIVTSMVYGLFTILDERSLRYGSDRWPRRRRWGAVGGLLLIGLAGPLAGQAQAPRDTTVIVEARSRVTADRLVQQIEDDALRRALGEAVKTAVGVSISTVESAATVEGPAQIAQRFAQTINAASHGRVTDYRVLASRWEQAPLGERYYWVRVEATVLRETGQPDPGFTIYLQLNQERYRSAARPEASDELVVWAQPSQDAYLTLFNITADTVQVLFPNPLMPDAFVPASTGLEFPSPAWRGRGVRLRTFVPSGRDHAVESILAVATKQPILFKPLPDRMLRPDAPEVNTVAATLREVQQWLVQIPLGERAVQEVSYLIEHE